ncbi:MAG TPA: class I SAM-dependent methyltransferase, partial [Gemmatimonadales bacterium]
MSCPVCRLEADEDAAVLGGYRLYQCRGCTLRFAPQAFGVPVDYDRVYQTAEYDREQVKVLQTVNPLTLAQHPTYRAFFDRVPHESGARLLDVGCGVGRFCLGAYALGWDVTGIDVSERAIKAGRPFARFPLTVATTEELAARGDRFDVATAFEVLEHLASPVEFLQTVQRVVSPGGQVFCTVPNWDSAVVRTSTRHYWLPPIDLLFFTAASLKAAGERSGLVGVTAGVI